MKRILILVALLSSSNLLIAQFNNMGIGTDTPEPSAVVDMYSTDKGVLVPRHDSTSRKAISSPAEGLLVYDTDYEGFWFFDGVQWLPILAGSTNAWNVDGNEGTTPSNNYIGTRDAQDFVVKTNSTEKVRVASGGDVTVQERVTVLGKYYLSRGSGTIISYATPTNGTFTLDFSTCATDTWCCTSGQEICLYNYSDPNLDDILELTLAGSNSLACTLLHYEDDQPRKYYYATDGGNDCGGMNTWCFRLKREGGNSNPIYTNSNFYIICF